MRTATFTKNMLYEELQLDFFWNATSTTTTTTLSPRKKKERSKIQNKKSMQSGSMLLGACIPMKICK